MAFQKFARPIFFKLISTFVILFGVQSSIIGQIEPCLIKSTNVPSYKMTIAKASDGNGYWISTNITNSWDNSSNLWDFYLMKIDAEGNLVVNKKNETPRSLQTTLPVAGGLLVGKFYGFISCSSGDSQSFMDLDKIDELGNTVWTKSRYTYTQDAISLKITSPMVEKDNRFHVFTNTYRYSFEMDGQPFQTTPIKLLLGYNEYLNLKWDAQTSNWKGIRLKDKSLKQLDYVSFNETAGAFTKKVDVPMAYEDTWTLATDTSGWIQFSRAFPPTYQWLRISENGDIVVNKKTWPPGNEPHGQFYLVGKEVWFTGSSGVFRRFDFNGEFIGQFSIDSDIASKYWLTAFYKDTDRLVFAGIDQGSHDIIYGFANCQSATSVNEGVSDKFRITPNPSDGYFKTDNLPVSVVSLKLLDQLGRPVSERTFEPGEELFFPELPAGFYFAVFIDRNQKVVFKSKWVKF